MGSCLIKPLCLFFKWHLSGQIPEQIAELKSLKELYLHGNELTGKFVAESNSLPTIQFVVTFLGSGEVPVCVGWLEELKELSLSRNKLRGEN